MSQESRIFNHFNTNNASTSLKPLEAKQKSFFTTVSIFTIYPIIYPIITHPVLFGSNYATNNWLSIHCLSIIKYWQLLELLQYIIVVNGSDQMMATILSGAPSALSSRPYQDHSECAQQAVKWKSLTASLSASKNSLPFPLCGPFIGILKAIKYDNSAISSRLNFPIIALYQSYFFLLGLFFSPHGVHMDSDALAHITVVMRGPWSPLRWHSDPN